MTLIAALARPDPRLDDEITPSIAVVRTVHAFVGVACLQVALGAHVAAAPMLPAVGAGLALVGSALLLSFHRRWVRWFAVVAGWVGMAAVLLAWARFPATPPLVVLLIAAMLWYGNRTLGGTPALAWQRLTPASPPAPPSPEPYDGRIEELD